MLDSDLNKCSATCPAVQLPSNGILLNSSCVNEESTLPKSNVVSSNSRISVSFMVFVFYLKSCAEVQVCSMLFILIGKHGINAVRHWTCQYQYQADDKEQTRICCTAEEEIFKSNKQCCYKHIN